MSAEGKRRLAKVEQEKKAMAARLKEAERELEQKKEVKRQAASELEKELQKVKLEKESAVREVRRDMEKRLEEAGKSKEAYRNAWEKAEGELQALKEERDKEKDERLKSMEEMVKSLRLDLEEARKKGKRCERRAFGLSEPSPATPDPAGFLFPPTHETTATSGEEDASVVGTEGHLGGDRTRRQLVERRATLLATGVYGEEDVLIRMLDREIGAMDAAAAAGRSASSLSRKRKSDET